MARGGRPQRRGARERGVRVAELLRGAEKRVRQREEGRGNEGKGKRESEGVGRVGLLRGEEAARKKRAEGARAGKWRSG
ncbi:unnamed protein product [Sphenostylis stenocarpa]|uniref:Uncharacterized protein n=1 Tax=Sphenostylis stenocarpa TaxID=92480 RepID=A0AA86S3W1_9FABA|nr:unnamed protein product [Sphenostylis stenocarpa]